MTGNQNAEERVLADNMPDVLSIAVAETGVRGLGSFTPGVGMDATTEKPSAVRP